MAAYIYTKLVGIASKSGVALAQHSRQSSLWLQKMYTEVNKSSVAPAKFLSEADRKRKKPRYGRMYMFLYEPKGKKDLPYYDRFPLIFPVEAAEGGFYGINLHYLPPPLRAKLLDALYEIQVNGDKNDETTRLRLSYKLLKGAARFRWFKPCFKHYLFAHMRSTFIYVPPEEWDMTVFLPSEQFKKATKEKVWKDSRNKI